MEKTAHRVSELQSKVEQTYNQGQEERRENSQLHEEHLKSEFRRKNGGEKELSRRLCGLKEGWKKYQT